MARKRQHDRDTLLERAVTLFWRQGYHATSLREVEAALDRRPGSIYADFGSKAGLFTAALERYAGDLTSEMEATLANAATPLAGLRAYLRSVAQACTATADTTGAPPSRACMLVKTVLEVRAEDHALTGQVNRLLDGMEARLKTALDTAAAAGELAEGVDTGRLARLLQAQIIGLRSFAQRQVPAAAVRDLAEDMVAIIDAHASPAAAAAGRPRHGS